MTADCALQIEADEYISAMPVDVMKRMEPKAWQKLPFFRQMDSLEVLPASPATSGTMQARHDCRCYSLTVSLCEPHSHTQVAPAA